MSLLLGDCMKRSLKNAAKKWGGRRKRGSTSCRPASIRLFLILGFIGQLLERRQANKRFRFFKVFGDCFCPLLLTYARSPSGEWKSIRAAKNQSWTEELLHGGQ